MWKHLSTAIGVRYTPPYNTLELGIPLFPSRAESCDFAVKVLSRSGRLNEQQMTLFWQAARLVDADLQELSHEMWLEMCANLGGGGDEIDDLYCKIAAFGAARKERYAKLKSIVRWRVAHADGGG